MAMTMADGNQSGSKRNAAIAARRADVVEMLAGAVLELLLRQERCPSLDRPLARGRAPKSAISRHIRSPQ